MTIEVDKLVDEISGVLQDSSYEAERIVSEINGCLDFVSSNFNVTSLSGEGTVIALATDVKVALPDDYLRELYYVTGADDREIDILSNLKILLKRYGSTDTGNIRAVAVVDKILYYRPKPTADESLQCHYYKKPEHVMAGMLMPLWIPEHLQTRLPKYYVLNKLFLEIEDGINSPTVNTTKYGQLFAETILELELFYPRASKQVPHRKRSLNWF